MDRLVEHLVAWHNSHPLAKRINIYDVHTIGVVALPFMRNGGAAAPSADLSARKAGRGGRPQEPIEPVLTDEVSPDSLAAWGEESTIAANSNAAELDALADQELWHRSSWGERFKRGLRNWRSRSPKPGKPRPAAGSDTWPAFSERFIAGLTPARIASFAQRFGYSEQPGDGSWPQRVVPIDELMMGGGSAGGDAQGNGGAWPFELYLVTAAIDAGRSRTRVLVGQGHPRPQIIGRRCLSPWRLGAVTLLPLGVLLMSAALLLLPSRKAVKEAEEAAAAAASASATISAASSPASAAAEDPKPEASEAAASAAAEAPATSAVAEPAAASSAGSADAAASAPKPAVPGLPAPLDLREAAAATAAAIAAAQQAALDKASGKDSGKSNNPDSGASAASEPQPDIRPQLVKPIPRKNARPMLADAPAPGSEGANGKPEDKNSNAAAKPADPVADLMNGPKPSPITAGRITSRDGERPTLHSAVAPPAGNSSGGSNKRSNSREDTPGSSSAGANAGNGRSGSASVGGSGAAGSSKATVVALVGPVSANKAEAEAMLERMKVALAANAGGGATQAQVFQTPEGWRPAVWPFASREQAQLINATLIARGLRTKAVDF